MPAKAPPKKSKSTRKRARQSLKRKLRNQSVKGKLRTLSKKVESEVISKNIEGAKAALNTAICAIDKAASRRMIHKNTAARKVSRLTRLFNSLSEIRSELSAAAT